MYQYKCMNQIAQFGLDHFTEDYKQTENMEEADALLVRSAALHEVDFPENLKAIARAGAGDVYKRQTSWTPPDSGEKSWKKWRKNTRT